MSSGSLNPQNSFMASTGCDCSQMSNVQKVAQTNAPTYSPSDGSTSSDAAYVASSAASGANSEK